jgi:hypothetical protein
MASGRGHFYSFSFPFARVEKKMSATVAFEVVLTDGMLRRTETRFFAPALALSFSMTPERKLLVKRGHSAYIDDNGAATPYQAWMNPNDRPQNLRAGPKLTIGQAGILQKMLECSELYSVLEESILRVVFGIKE